MHTTHTPLPVPPAGIVKGGPISYHGGSVMTGDLNMYLLWYGNWNRSSVEDIRTMATLTHMVKYISGSSWMNINRQYYYQAGGGSKVYTKGRLTYKGSLIVPAAPGATIVTDNQLQGEWLCSWALQIGCCGAGRCSWVLRAWCYSWRQRCRHCQRVGARCMLPPACAPVYASAVACTCIEQLPLVAIWLMEA